jgi:GT2 family glycosyltransferase
MNRSKWTLWLRMLGTFFRKPSKVVRHVSLKRFRTLWFALRHEPPSLIWHNFVHLLNNQDRSTLYRAELFYEEGGILAYFERVQIFSLKIHLSGWLIGKNNPIAGVDVLIDSEKTGSFSCDINRPDVIKKYGTTYARSGFDYLGPTPDSSSDVKLRVRLEDGSNHLVEVPVLETDRIYQNQIISKEDDRVRRSAIRRRVRRRGMPLPPIALQVTDEQWAVLTKGKNKYPCKVYRYQSTRPGDLLLQLTPHTTPHPDLLWAVISALPDTGELPIGVYWDEDQLLPSGKRTNPHFKPAFSLDYLLSWNYIGYNFCFRQSPSMPLTDIKHPLSILANFQQGAFIRIPEVLSHCPAPQERNKAREEKARQEYIQAHITAGKLQHGILNDTWRVRYPVDTSQRVTIIIPFRDQVSLLKQCLESLAGCTNYEAYDILLVNNQSKEPETLAYLKHIDQEHHVKVLHYDAPFNYAALHNWAIDQVTTPYVLLLNNDTEFFEPGWLVSMMEYAQQPEVGAVGAKLLYPDDTLQHAGVIVGIGGAADHAHKHLPATAEGYFYRANTVQELSACTAACLLLPTHIYKEAGGMDPEKFPVAFNDVDLCLTIQSLGYRIIYTPHAVLYHHESISRGIDQTRVQRERASREIKAFRRKWRTFLENGDPYYHPRLSLRSGHFELAN